jgi:sRNA-binding protein
VNYRPTREESENIIRLLIEHYPKCFFENPKQRRPLKKNIETDIKNDTDLNVGPDAIDAAVAWYRTHIGYDYALAAGAKRVDLTGREVGTITQAEAQAAQQRINEIHKAKTEQRESPVEVLQNMHATRRISDDGVKKLDAPVISRSKVAHPPEFVEIYEKLAAASAAVISINDPAMRVAVVKATLEEVLKTIEKVKEGL